MLPATSSWSCRGSCARASPTRATMTSSGRANEVRTAPWRGSHRTAYGWDTTVAAARGLRRLSACGRLILCDLRGYGASDSIGKDRLPAMQAWMDDIGAVLDAAESSQATLIAASEAGLPVMLFAA